MRVTLANLAAIAAAIAALFGLVIAFGLRQRRRGMTEANLIRARDLILPAGVSAATANSLLYAIRQDVSATELGLLVRNERDEEIGRITFHMARRTGAMSLIVAGESFEADVLPTMRQRIVMHPAGNPATAVCTFDRGAWATHRFAVAGVGTVESKPGSRLRVAATRTFTLNGRAIGISQQIGGIVNRGVMLVLSDSIPLPVRVFILATQA